MLCSTFRKTLRDDVSARSAAFSLIELLVVIIILSMLGTIAVPRYSQFSAHQQVESAARRIVTDLEWARRHANTTSTSQTVVFNTAAHTYTLSPMTHPDHPGQSYVVKLGQDPYRTRILSATFGGDATLVFNGYGTPDSSGSVIIAVGGYQKTISLDGKLGRAKAQ